jgi:phage gpG-like protein
MSTIRITLTPDGARAMQRLRTMPERLAPALMAGIDVALEEGMTQTLKNRFTGNPGKPFPPQDRRLRAISGRLRGSFTRNPCTESGGVFTASIGSNVKYWLAHEFGFNGPVQVRAHTRRVATDAKGNRIALRAAQTSRAKVKPTISTGTVRAHTRQMFLPERRMMRTGMEEQTARMSEIVSNFLVRALP